MFPIITCHSFSSWSCSYSLCFLSLSLAICFAFPLYMSLFFGNLFGLWTISHRNSLSVCNSVCKGVRGMVVCKSFVFSPSSVTLSTTEPNRRTSVLPSLLPPRPLSLLRPAGPESAKPRACYSLTLALTLPLPLKVSFENDCLRYVTYTHS